MQQAVFEAPQEQSATGRTWSASSDGRVRKTKAESIENVMFVGQLFQINVTQYE